MGALGYPFFVINTTIMRLKTFLFELSVVQGNDIDFIDNSNYVILFSKDDNYSLEGKTHGLLSHSIKHLREFNPSLVKTLLHKTISILLKYKNSLFFYKKGTGFITSGYPKITDSIVLTTLDAIQDKIQLKKSLSPIEKEISNEVLNQFEMEYKKIVDQIMANGVDITNLSVEDIIKVFGQNKKYAIIVCGNGDSMYIDINSG